MSAGRPAGTRTTTIPVVVGDELWLSTLDGAEVLVIDPAGGEILERIAAQWPMGFAEADGLLWVTEASADGSVPPNERLIGIDIATREIVREIPLPGLGIDRGITSDGQSLWLAAGPGLVRVDP